MLKNKKSLFVRFRLFVIAKCRASLTKEYLKFHGVDLHCGNCETWASDRFYTFGEDQLKNHADFGYSTKCAQCSSMSYWNVHLAPFPVPCAEDGRPIESSEFRIAK